MILDIFEYHLENIMLKTDPQLGVFSKNPRRPLIFSQVTCFYCRIEETYCYWKTEKMHIPKTMFLTLKSFRKLFLRAVRIKDSRNFSLEESLSKTASYKNGARRTSVTYVLWTSFFTFYCSIIA